MTMENAEPRGRLYIPALGRIWDGLDRFAHPLLRAGLGIILITHGVQKVFGWLGGGGPQATADLFTRLGYEPGMLWAMLVGLTETIGGLLLVIGLLVRPAAAAVVIFMIFAIEFTSRTGARVSRTVVDGQIVETRTPEAWFWLQGGAEYSFLILLVALFFLIRGGGPLSLDRRIGREF